MPSQRGLPAAQGRSLRRRGPRGFTSRCSPSRRRFRRLDTASAPRPLTNGHLLGHSQTDAAPPLSRSALRSELRPPGRAAIRVISTSSLHLKRGTLALSSSPPRDYPHRRTLGRGCCIAWFGTVFLFYQPCCGLFDFILRRSQRQTPFARPSHQRQHPLRLCRELRLCGQ